MSEAKQAFRAFKMQGLALHADALERLIYEMKNEPSLSLDSVIFAIKNSIDRSKRTFDPSAIYLSITISSEIQCCD